MKSIVEPICNNTHSYIVQACVFKYGEVEVVVVVVVVFNSRCFYKRYIDGVHYVLLIFVRNFEGGFWFASDVCTVLF